MEKPTPQQPKKHLLIKRPAFMITNACNMTCGACHQFCGQFKKEQLFFVSVDQFRQGMKTLTDWQKDIQERRGFYPPVHIYGGEPTVHPQWEQLLEIMWENDHLAFIVFTNGRWLVGDNPCLSDIYDLESEEFVDCFIKVDLAQERLYEGRTGFLNVHQTKSETQMLTEMVNRQNFPCECGGKEYEFVGYHKEFRPRHPDGHKYKTYYRCKQCGVAYRWNQARIQDSINGRFVSKSLKEKLDALPYNPLPKHVVRFAWDKIQSVVRNVGYRIDSKAKEVVRWAAPVAMAPIDYVTAPQEYFWKAAQNNCKIWENCESMIYDDKAYFCIVAGAMDRLYYDGKYGWPIEEGKNPFLRMRKDLDEQAKHFCYRCGFACGVAKATMAAGEMQLACSETIASPTNFPYLKKARMARNTGLIPLL